MGIDLGIVLLNYNTPHDTLCAIDSLQKFTHITYKICVVDNSSDDKKRVPKDKVDSNIVDVLYLNENKGYADGNNKGVDYLISKYTLPFVLIMNPDVQIIKDYTLDSLLRKLSVQDDTVCGIQPLVWTPRFGSEPALQCNIRTVKNYFDCCISCFHPFQYIFKKRFRRMVYEDLKPYKKDVVFEVPSGCFFIIKTTVVKEIGGLFDSNTFLYNEEFILGYKIKEKGYHFLFDVSQIVQHEQGGSTGQNKVMISPLYKKHHKQSLGVYLKDYLKVGKISISFINFLIDLNYWGKYLKYNILKH